MLLVGEGYEDGRYAERAAVECPCEAKNNATGRGSLPLSDTSIAEYFRRSSSYDRPATSCFPPARHPARQSARSRHTLFIVMKKETQKCDFPKIGSFGLLAMPVVPCCVCQDASKYKCPKCLARYCSVVCYKVHKEGEGCAAAEAAAGGSGSGSSSSAAAAAAAAKAAAPRWVPPPVGDEDDMPKITDDHRHLLDASSELRGALKSDELRALIKKVVSSPNPDYALKMEMDENPRLRQFADMTLLTAGLGTESDTSGCGGQVVFMEPEPT